MDFGRRTSHLSASLRRHERDSAAWAPRTVPCSPVLDSVAKSFVRAPRMLRRGASTADRTDRVCGRLERGSSIRFPETRELRSW